MARAVQAAEWQFWEGRNCKERRAEVEGSGCCHNIVRSGRAEQGASQSGTLLISDLHLSKAFQASAVLDSRLSSRIADMQSARFPNTERRRTSRWCSRGRARDARHPASPSWTRPLATMVGLRPLWCWAWNWEVLSVLHPQSPSLADLARAHLPRLRSLSQ